MSSFQKDQDKLIRNNKFIRITLLISTIVCLLNTQTEIAGKIMIKLLKYINNL